MFRDPTLNLVLDSFADLVVVSDASNRVRYVNRAVESLLGWRPEDMVGQPLTSLMPERMRAAHERGFARYLASRQPRLMGRPVRVPALHRDGTEREVELTLSSLRDPFSGEELFIASIRDLRDRVELERKLEAQRLLATQYAVMLCLADARDEQEAAERVLETIGRHLGWGAGSYLRADAGGERLEALAFWQASEVSVVEFGQATRRRIFARGEGMPGRVLERGEPLWSPDVTQDPRFERGAEAMRSGLHAALIFPVHSEGRVIGVLEFFSRQIQEPDEELRRTLATLGGQMGMSLERIRLERERDEHLRRERAARAEAQAALQAREEFLSIASHELRTPLSALLLQLENLRRAAVSLSPEQMLARTDAMRRAAQRLQRLMEVLLDESRLNSEQLELELVEVDLSALVREVAGRFQEQLEQAGCTLRLHADVPLVGRWDALRLEQVVTNLLTNAAKYGAGRPVEVRVEAQGAHARLSVRDEGIGIAPEEQERLFQRFGRAVSDRHYGGFGLGLWIVRRITEALGGAVSVQSAPGRGSTFTVDLPLTPRLSVVGRSS